MRRYGYMASAQAIPVTANPTMTIPSTFLPKAGVGAFHFIVTGTNNGLSGTTGIVRTRIKVDSQLVIDALSTHLRAWFERFSLSNFAYAVNAKSFTIPFYFPDARDENVADQCQLPAGNVQIEFTFTSTPTAGNIFVGWTLTDQPMSAKMKLTGKAMNITAPGAGLFNQNNQVDFRENGSLRGLVLNTAGLDRVRCKYNEGSKDASEIGELFDSTGSQTDGGPLGGMMLEAQRVYSPYAAVSADPFVFKLPDGLPLANRGSSYLTVDVEDSWGGVTNELGTYWILAPTA